MAAENGGLTPARESEPKRLTVFIVDRQPIFRRGIQQALSTLANITVAGESSFAPNIWSVIEKVSPDVALVGIGVGANTPTEFGVARQIATRCPGVAVVVLASSPDDEQLFQAMKSGAVAFLGKDATVEELSAVLRQVGRREYPINDSLLDRPNAARQVLNLFHSFSRRKDMEHLLTPLSQREMEVLKYIAEGNPNKRIAYALNISEQTIKNHMTSIMRKLNVNDRTHAVVVAIRQGWLNVAEFTEAPGIEQPAPLR